MKKAYIGGVAVFLGAAMAALAQQGGSGSDPAQWAMERLSKILEKQSFSARVIMTMAGMDRSMELAVMASHGRIRMEMDMAKMGGAAGKDAAMPPGMDKTITITRMDKKTMYYIMPGLNGYVETAIPEAAAGGDGSSAKMDRTVEGNETVEGYECEKVRNRFTMPDGTSQVMMTWEAKKLQGLPVKVEFETPTGPITTVYKDIKTGKLADSLFEPPAGCTKYDSTQAMVAGGMMKMIGGAE